MKEFIFKKDENGNLIASINPDFIRQSNKDMYDYKLKKSGIPKEYYKYSFDNIFGFTKEVLDKSKEYVETFSNNEDTSLYFIGERNSGKTALSCIIGMELLKKGFDVSFVEFQYLQDCFITNQGFSKNEEIEVYIKKIKKSDIIIIDDCYDPEKSIRWKNSNHLIIAEWNYFIRSHISNEKKFIKTSNIPIKEVGSYWGKDIASMLSEGRGKFLEIFVENTELSEKRKQRLELKKN